MLQIGDKVNPIEGGGYFIHSRRCVNTVFTVIDNIHHTTVGTYTIHKCDKCHYRVYTGPKDRVILLPHIKILI